MRCLPVVILAVLLVAAEGKAVPDSDVENQQAPTQSSQIPEYINQANEIIKNLSTQIQQQVQNLPDHFNAIKEETAKLGTNIQGYLNNATAEIKAKNPELEALWTNIHTKMSEAMNNLNVNPETTEQLNQLRAKFQEGVQTVMTESENVAKTFNDNTSKAQDEFSKFTKNMIDIAVQASQDLHNKLQQATPAPEA